MRIIVYIAVFVLVLPFQVMAGNGSEYVPHEILIKFAPDTPVSEKEKMRGSLNATRLRTIRSIGVEHWSLPDNVTVRKAVDHLSGFGAVLKVEPNYLYSPQTVPNDSSFSRLWHLDNTGQTVNGVSGTPGADISAVRAWDLERGSKHTVIAVLDSGVAFDHPDLTDNIWVNNGEIPDNGRDDDNNGYVDDVNGWDFVNSDNLPHDYSKDLYTDGHGTHVAGIIAASGNNGQGVTGVLWSARIMPLQIFDLFQVDTFEAAVIQHIRIISAIEYAVDNGARIINCSFGGPSATQFMYDVIDYANRNGVLVVAAAGNSGENNDLTPSYPASYELPNIIAVAATDQDDNLADYSNYGEQSVDLAAPGGSGIIPNIYSTTPPERVVLFSDDFESGGDKWVTASNYEDWFIGYDSFHASYMLQSSSTYYSNNEYSYAETYQKINAADCRGVHLQFDLSYFLETEYDYLYVERSVDGNNYSIIDQITGYSGITLFREWESEAEFGEFYLRFRLSTDYSQVEEGVFIDNILVSGVPWHYDGSEYNYKTGTSMSTPVVSGVAGLVWSRNSNLSHLQVKDILLNSVDRLPDLKGKVLSAGRVNAYRALVTDRRNTLFFPHIASDSLWETSICLLNRSAEPVAGTVEAYDSQGVKVAPDHSVSLTPRMRMVFEIERLYSNHREIAYLIFRADSRNMAGYSRFSREGLYRATVPAISSTSSADLYLPRITSGGSWWTGLALLNTTASAKVVTLEFDNGMTRSIALAGRERKAFSIRSVAGEDDHSDLHSVVIREAEGITGLALLGNRQQLVGLPLVGTGAFHANYPHLPAPGKWQTEAVIYNPRGINTTLTLQPFTEDGSVLAPVNVALDNSLQWRADTDSLDLPAGTAWFRIEAEHPIIGSGFLSSNDDQLLAGHSTIGDGKTRGIFPGLDRDGWTGLALTNLEDSSTLVDLTAYSDSGNVVSMATIELGPSEKMVGLAESFFREDIIEATYIIFYSDTELAGFQLNASSDGRSLDSLPAM